MDADRFRNSPLGQLVPLAGTDGRTGHRFDHVAYVADPLAAEPELASTTWHAVTGAHRALARLDQAAQQIPAPELLLSPTLRREAQSTSALEGTYAPLESVFEADVVPSAGRSSELSEVLNYLAAARDAFTSMADGRTVTVGLLEHIHGVLVRDTESPRV